MKNIFLVILTSAFLFSCQHMACMPESQHKIDEAQKMYNSFGTVLARDITEEKARKMFGCHYELGDDVYEYSTFWGKKYILARDGEAITYYEK